MPTAMDRAQDWLLRSTDIAHYDTRITDLVIKESMMSLLGIYGGYVTVSNPSPLPCLCFHLDSRSQRSLRYLMVDSKGKLEARLIIIGGCKLSTNIQKYSTAHM